LTALTKTFIVLHVVLSLLLAAGVIVFVNQTENFKLSNATLSANLATARAQASAAKADATRLGYDVTAARTERDAAITAGQAKVAAAQLEIAKAQSQAAASDANFKMAQASVDNTTLALTASETARKALSDNLDAARDASNKLAVANSQLNLAVADLTNKLEVAIRQVTNLNESVAEYKTLKENYEKKLTDAGIPLTGPSGIAGGAPPIDGIIRHTQMIGGIPYATISVGSQDQVKAGMKFNVVDSAHGKFLGELTVEKVDEREATGRLEGPGINAVHDEHPGESPIEVKTQLY